MKREQKIIDSLIDWYRREPENIQVLSDLFGMCVHIENDNFEYAHKLNKTVRNESAKIAVQNNSIKHLELYKKSLLFDAPHELDAYLQYVEFDREPESRFYLPRRKQLLQVVEALQGLIDDDLDLVTVSMPPGTGKLLADDTPVLTTEGWKKHGDLRVGDKVFNHLGQAVKVTHVFPKNYAEYEITFSNNEKILAHGDHEWVLYDRSRNCQRIVETKELANTRLWYGKRGKRGSRCRFGLPLRKPIEGIYKDLPVNPYVLGVWLGDGTEVKPTITIHEKDNEVIRELEKHYVISKKYELSEGTYAYHFLGLRQDLQKLGMCHSRKKWGKRIPEIYLTAHIEQRLELLAGLIDTDGNLNGRKYKISTINEELRDDIVKLISTFGWRTSVMVEEPKLSTGNIQGKSHVYKIQFTPDIEIPTRLKRKQLKPFGKQRRIYVTDIRKIEPVKGNCIEVEGGIYLVGKTMIPTHNSTLGIFFLTWVMGKYPMQPNLVSAHSAKLTRSFYDGVLQILTDPEYLYGDVFPTVKIVSQSAKDETIDLNRHKRFKTLTCRSIDGTLTGATRCEKILYADDLVSGIEEALSIDRLDSLWFKYTNDLKSRKKEGCKELHIATRWSVHDIIGRLEREYGGNPRAKFIVLPALDENDESNFDYPYGVGFSTEYFHDMRNNLDDASWRALYMNQPIEREGLVFSEDELNRYYELPRREPDAIIATCDTAEGGGDSVCLVVGYVYGNEVYIEDVVFNNSLPDVTKPLCVNILLKHKVQQCRFESNNAGGGFADDIQKEIEKRGGITHITKKRTTSNKLTRIIVNSDYVKKNFYFKDKSKYAPGSEYGRYMKELTGFTHAGKNAHDDAPDGTVMLVEFLQSLNMSKVEVFKRPF